MSEKSVKKTQIGAILKGGGTNHEKIVRDFLLEHPNEIAEKKETTFETEDFPDYTAVYQVETTVVEKK